MTIHNQSAQDDALTAVSSDCCKKIEMHESIMQSGAMTMQQHDKVSLPASTGVEFAAGGLHLMMFNPVRPLRDGDEVTMTLHFAHHAPLTIKAVVKRATGGMEHHHHHQ
jgi:copper(I)-binding protein